VYLVPFARSGCPSAPSVLPEMELSHLRAASIADIAVHKGKTKPEILVAGPRCSMEEKLPSCGTRKSPSG